MSRHALQRPFAYRDRRGRRWSLTSYIAHVFEAANIRIAIVMSAFVL